MTETQVEFGRKLRDAEFMLDPKSVHINQGSWGTSPRRVYDAQNKIRERMEFQPDHFFRRMLLEEWFDSLRACCKFLNIKPENATFVENATSGINVVLKSLKLKPGDQILVYSWTYKAILYAAQRTAEMTGAEVVTLDIRYPVKSKEDVVDKYRTMFNDNPNIKVAILDYISSPTATLFPIADIVAVCREHGVLSLVDGAHTPGQIEPNIENIMPDFYTGNMHKWVFCPRASAILWVNPLHHDIISPLVTSHHYKVKPWNMEFQQQGTRDHSVCLSTPTGIEFYESLGGREAITAYVEPLLEKAVSLLVEKWGTRRFDIPRDMEAPFLKIVRLPDSGYHIPNGSKEIFGDQHQLMTDLFQQFNMHVTALTIQDEPWIRLSGTVYNSIEEFDKLADAVLTLVKENPQPNKDKLAQQLNKALVEPLGGIPGLTPDLFERFNMHVVVLRIQDEPWIRLSGTVYNSIEEYDKLADAVLTLVKENPPPQTNTLAQ